MRVVLEGKNQNRCARGVTLGAHVSEEFCFSAYLAVVSSLLLPCFELSHVRLSSTLGTIAHQGIFLTQGLNPRLLHWQVDPLTTEPPERPQLHSYLFLQSQRGRSAVEVAICCVQLRSHVQLFGLQPSRPLWPSPSAEVCPCSSCPLHP